MAAPLGRFPSTDGLSPRPPAEVSLGLPPSGVNTCAPPRCGASGIPLIQALDASGACAPRRAGPSLLAKRPGAWERSAGEAAASPPVCRVTNHPTSRPLSQFAALSASGHPLIIVGHSPPARPADALFGPPVRESTAAGRSSSTAAWTTRRPRRHRWSCARGGESGLSRRGSRSSRPRLAGSIRSHVFG